MVAVDLDTNVVLSPPLQMPEGFFLLTYVDVVDADGPYINAVGIPVPAEPDAEVEVGRVVIHALPIALVRGETGKIQAREGRFPEKLFPVFYRSIGDVNRSLAGYFVERKYPVAGMPEEPGSRLSKVIRAERRISCMTSSCCEKVL